MLTQGLGEVVFPIDITLCENMMTSIWLNGAAWIFETQQMMQSVSSGTNGLADARALSRLSIDQYLSQTSQMQMHCADLL